MAVELRWVVPAGTTTAQPRLQYRNWGQWPAGAGPWVDVPTMVEKDEPRWVCPRCGTDRLKEPCPSSVIVDCPMVAKAQGSAGVMAAPAPLGWLYDWTHSSAIGKPDEHFTGFTTDEAYARKHDNPRQVYAAPAGVAGTFHCRKPAIGPACETQCERCADEERERNAGVPRLDESQQKGGA